MLERSLVSVVAGAVAKLIVPVETVRAELGLDSTSDPKLRRLIYAAGSAFAGMGGLGRPFLRQTFLEKTQGDGGPLLVLSRWPIESVTSVTYGISDPTTITASEYSIALEGRNALYRSTGWSGPCEDIRQRVVTGGDFYSYSATYVAGWVPPGDGPGLVDKWRATTARVAGSFVKPDSAANGAITLLYECTTAGTSGASEPTWPTTSGSTVTDGTVTWTARDAMELPFDFQEAAIVTVKAWMDGGLDAAAGISSERHGSMEVVYDTAATRGALPPIPPAARAMLWSYR